MTSLLSTIFEKNFENFFGPKILKSRDLNILITNDLHVIKAFIQFHFRIFPQIFFKKIASNHDFSSGDTSPCRPLHPAFN